jgi:hypothetical protein
MHDKEEQSRFAPPAMCTALAMSLQESHGVQPALAPSGRIVELQGGGVSRTLPSCERSGRARHWCKIVSPSVPPERASETQRCCGYHRRRGEGREIQRRCPPAPTSTNEPQ